MHMHGGMCMQCTGHAVRMQCTRSAHAVRMHTACSAHAMHMQWCACSGAHAAAHRLARGDVVLNEESDAHAAQEDPVDVSVDDRLGRVWVRAQARVWARAWTLASGSGLWIWIWAWAWAPVVTACCLRGIITIAIVRTSIVSIGPPAARAAPAAPRVRPPAPPATHRRPCASRPAAPAARSA